VTPPGPPAKPPPAPPRPGVGGKIAPSNPSATAKAPPPAAPQNPFCASLKEDRVMVAVGAGGVGKTTVAAALALRAAVDGRSSLVCTIDPAKRLANSLGLKELGNAESLIPEPRFQAAGLTPKAPLRAMMLDMKQTWDELIERLAPPGKREKILQNRFYQSLSSALAGSQEYIAMEKLWQLRTQRDSGLSDEEWWRQISPTLTTVMSGTHFPVAGRVGTSVGEHFQSVIDPAHALSFGLSTILDGLAQLIESRSAVQ